MRELISNVDLENVMYDVISDINLYSHEIKIAAKMQYLTGCRANDVLEADRWILLMDGNLQLQPQKGNNIRTFEPLDVDNDFYDYIVEGHFLLDGLNYRKYNYYIELAMHKYAFKVFSKSITSHLFRHNYAKKLHDTGMSDVDIQNKLGERRLSSAVGYIYSPITWQV